MTAGEEGAEGAEDVNLGRLAKPLSAEMQPGVGFRIRADIERPDPQLVRAFAAFATADISDVMNRLYTMSPSIRNVTDPNLRLGGTACTVKVFPGDNLMVHKSLDIAQPGDVLVVDASSSMMTAVLGSLVAVKARHRGIVGMVVDGLVRDVSGIQSLGDFPVFARGVTPIGPLHRGPGEINYPVSAGGIVVHPGDVIVGDLDGVAVVPRDAAETVLARVEARTRGEAEYIAAVARGEFSNAWVDAILADNDVPSDDDANP
jgi:RraA family protein